MTLPFVVFKTKWDVICDQVLWKFMQGLCPKLVVTEGVRGLPGGGGRGGERASGWGWRWGERTVQQRSVVADASL